MNDRPEMPPGFAALMGALGSQAKAEEDETPYDPDHFDTDRQWLVRNGNAYLTEHDFKPGQIVRVKSALTHPKSGQPTIVIAYVPGQRNYEGNPSSNSWGTRVDLCLGVCVQGDHLLTIWLDSGYFEPVP